MLVQLLYTTYLGYRVTRRNRFWRDTHYQRKQSIRTYNKWNRVRKQLSNPKNLIPRGMRRRWRRVAAGIIAAAIVLYETFKHMRFREL